MPSARRRRAGFSPLLLEGHAEQSLGPHEQHHDHDRERHRALQERALREREDGDRLDVANDERADQAALEAAQAAEHHDREHGDERRGPHHRTNNKNGATTTPAAAPSAAGGATATIATRFTFMPMRFATSRSLAVARIASPSRVR